MAKQNVELPEIGEGVTEGELVQWLVKAGDSIEVDQPLAEVLTDKATVEIPSSVAGSVVELKAGEGDVIEVGQTMLVLDTDGAGSTSTAPATEEKKEETPPPVQAPPTAMHESIGNQAMAQVSPPVAESHVLATPSTRRFARESGVDINTIKGTGVAGRVTRDDVAKFAGAGATAAGAPSYQPTISVPKSFELRDDERVPLRGIRRKIAEKMQLSKQVIPHFSIMDEANVTELVTLRNGIKEKLKAQGVRVTYMPFVMKALIASAKEFPAMNASIDDAAGEIIYRKSFNIGFAADTPNGLVVPVIKNADQKTILEISKEIVALSEKARAGKLTVDEMQGATITITNIGSIGGTYATPVINHPEVAIIGMYKMKKAPIFVGDEVKAAHIMNMSCTADHRLIDGAVAARFLASLIQRLENPSLLMLDLM